jgi:hypothetical protein
MINVKDIEKELLMEALGADYWELIGKLREG